MTNENTHPAGQGRLDVWVGRYPLDVSHCMTDGGAYCMSKGHHDAGAFLAEVRQALGDEDLSDWGEPRHEWWRVVPDVTEEYRRLFHPARPGSRGAFPVTVIDY